METVEYLDVHALAGRLGMSASALHKYRMNGSGPPYSKMGARVLYRWSDVVAWLEKHKANSVNEHRRRKKR